MNTHLAGFGNDVSSFSVTLTSLNTSVMMRVTTKANALEGCTVTGTHFLICSAGSFYKTLTVTKTLHFSHYSTLSHQCMRDLHLCL